MFCKLDCFIFGNIGWSKFELDLGGSRADWEPHDPHPVIIYADLWERFEIGDTHDFLTKFDTQIMTDATDRDWHWTAWKRWSQSWKK